MNLFVTLGKALADRGHHVTFFGISDIAEKIRGSGLDYQQLEPEGVPVGTLSSLIRSMADARGIRSLKIQQRFDSLRSAGILEKGPKLVKEAKMEALVIDQAEACGGSLAEFLNLPWVTVCSALCLNSEPQVPPFFTPWNYAISNAAIGRNQLAYAIARLATRPAQSLINSYRKKLSLPPFGRLDDTFSPFAQICQQNQEFDFPRKQLPKCFHYVGPIRSPAFACEFPWDLLDSRPLIYASLGTLFNQHKYIYRIIAEACAGLNAQLVLSLGGGAEAGEYSHLPRSPLVVKFAPQRELLAKATLTITHAGLNTTLESLNEGVPLVAVPITSEQPAIAARIRWTGTGDFIGLSHLTAKRLRLLIERILADPNYRSAAQRMKAAIRQTQGAAQAVEITEEVIRTGKPVLAETRVLVTGR
jgi:zeaxanthin glucosyltransferase